MPKIKQSAMSKKDKELISLIRKYLFINNVGAYEIGLAMRMSEATYYNRLKNPGNFSIEEIRKLSKKLGIPPGEILSYIL